MLWKLFFFGKGGGSEGVGSPCPLFPPAFFVLFLFSSLANQDLFCSDDLIFGKVVKFHI